ncbi:hypothetical protein P4S72_09645 [Vibrio sp. PP-XX7]
MIEAMRIYQRHDWLMIELGDVAISLGFISCAQMFFRRIPYEHHEAQLLFTRNIDTVWHRVVEEVRRFSSLEALCPLEGIWVMGTHLGEPWIAQLQREIDCPIEPFCPSQLFVRGASVKKDMIESSTVKGDHGEKERIDEVLIEEVQIVGARPDVDAQQGTALSDWHGNAWHSGTGEWLCCMILIY